MTNSYCLGFLVGLYLALGSLHAMAHTLERCPLELYTNGQYQALTKGLEDKIWDPDQLIRAMVAAAVKADEDWIDRFLSAYQPLDRDLGRGKTILHSVLGTKPAEEGTDVSRSILIQRILYKAASCTSHPHIQKLVQKQDRCRRNALYFAVKNNLLLCARALLEAGANVNTQCTPDRLTATMVASKQGNVTLLKELITSGADLARKCIMGTSALAIACIACKPECVKLLLTHHAPLEQKDPGGMTPLMHACYTGQKECVEILLDVGAKLSATDHIKNSAPMFAIKSKSIAILELLLNRATPAVLDTWQQDCRLVEIAVAYDQVNVVEMLMNYGWDLKQTNVSGWSVLHCAVDCRPPMSECFQFLLQHYLKLGLNANLVARNGDTPLHCACSAFNHSVFDALFSLGADPDMCNSEMDTPISKCLVSLYMDCFEIDTTKLLCVVKLLRYGCNPLIGISKTIKGILEMVRVSLWNQIFPGSMQQFLKNDGPKQLVRIILDMLYVGIHRNKQPFRDALLSIFDENNLSIENKQAMLTTYDTYCWSRYYQSNSLTLICRDAIRRTMQKNIEKKIEALPLPQHIKQFLNLPELEELRNEYEQVMKENFKENYFDISDEDDASDMSVESSDSYEMSSEQTESESDFDSDYSVPNN